MKDIDYYFDKCRYFSKDSKIDQWGDVRFLDGKHLLKLDDFRHYIGVPVYVTSSVRRSNGSKSYHNPGKHKNGRIIKACATDIIIPEYDKSPYDLVLDATRFGFTGIGYYPHWRWDGEIVGGLHVDSRPLKWEADETINYKHSRWMGVLAEDNSQRYISLTFENMLKYSGFSDRIGDMH